MGSFVALLRAVNVGGTGKLPMTELKAMCEALGFAAVRTYIASGNVVFTTRKSEAAVKSALEQSLRAYAGAPVGVLVRSAAEMAKVVVDNPFPKAAPNRTVSIFLVEVRVIGPRTRVKRSAVENVPSWVAAIGRSCSTPRVSRRIVSGIS